MPSIVWNRHPEEAYKNPYEYEAQKQFVRECRRVLQELKELINSNVVTYGRDERSLNKALWMLRTDTIDSLTEALELIAEKRHRAASGLFRCALDTVDLAYYFASEHKDVNKHLSQWYTNKSPSHGEVRKWLDFFEGEAQAKNRREFYNELSKFTHRSYRDLLKSYSLSKDDLLVHDEWKSDKSSILPHIITACYCVFADLIKLFVQQLVTNEVLSQQEEEKIWQKTLEKETVTRKFGLKI
ncbi:MAG: hypothetical protein AAGF83_23730 [Cyanobacteria bacterium P01_G01_bin.67]